MICTTPESKRIWDAIERHIDDTPTDGIAADGGHSYVVQAQQQGIVEGLRIARLAAIRALTQ